MLKVVMRALAVSALASAVPACTGSSDAVQASASESGGGGDGCTLTQGYWKNHPGAWPVASLSLGSTLYDETELLAILGEPVHGNGLVALAHQLIAAKLNVAAGASDADIAGAIADADAMIGGRVCPPIGDGSLPTNATSSLVGALDGFNEGHTGPGHCGDTPPPMPDAAPPPPPVDAPPPPCDAPPPPPPPVDAAVPCCGNGIVEPGEECDDGNTVDGDGCSATCVIETCVTSPLNPALSVKKIPVAQP